MTDEVEGKNDSGLDFDVSSATCSSQEEEVAGRQIQVQPRNDTETANFSVVSEKPTTSSKQSTRKARRSESMHSLRMSQRARRNHSQSGGSVRSERIRTTKRSRMVALRDSIAEDLQHAHSFSSNLRDSICKELDQVSCHDVKQTPGMFAGLMCAGSRTGLAGSIAESYNFGRGGDDWTYIHQFLQASLPPKPEYIDSSRQRGPGPRPCPEGCSVITSDQLYPASPRGDQVKPLKTSFGSKNRDAPKACRPKSVVSVGGRGKKRDTVYVIQNPEAKHMVASCIAQKKCLQTANGTFNFEVLDSFVWVVAPLMFCFQ